MATPNEPAAAGAIYLALKILAYVGEAGMVAGILYAAWSAGRYWSGIGV